MYVHILYVSFNFLFQWWKPKKKECRHDHTLLYDQHEVLVFDRLAFFAPHNLHLPIFLPLKMVLSTLCQILVAAHWDALPKPNHQL